MVWRSFQKFQKISTVKVPIKGTWNFCTCDSTCAVRTALFFIFFLTILLRANYTRTFTICTVQSIWLSVGHSIHLFSIFCIFHFPFSIFHFPFSFLSNSKIQKIQNWNESQLGDKAMDNQYCSLRLLVTGTAEGAVSAYMQNTRLDHRVYRRLQAVSSDLIATRCP